MFPSPIGDLYFLIVDISPFVYAGKTVSVPYRGSIFLNESAEFEQYRVLVSVPYRGSIFLNPVLENPCIFWVLSRIIGANFFAPFKKTWPSLKNG